MDIEHLSNIVTQKTEALVKDGFKPEQISDLCIKNHNGDTFALVDVIFEGGGAKGIGLVGAMYALETLGLRWRKVGGTSAGSILAALVVCNKRDYLDSKAPEILNLVGNLNFLSFLDGGKDSDYLMSSLSTAAGTRPRRLKKAWGLLRNLDDINRDLGVNPGRNFVPQLESHMATAFQGYTTQLNELENLWNQQAVAVQRLNPDFTLEDLKPDFQTVSFDITNHRKATLPRDIHIYAHQHSSLNVLELVRASMSIPFIFQPAKMHHIVGGQANLKGVTDTLLVDGGLVENFPLRMFDGVKNDKFNCPTIGIMIDEGDKAVLTNTINSPTQLALNLVKGLIEQQWDQLNDPIERARTIFVSNKIKDRYVSALDFSITPDEKNQLFINGVDAALDMIKNFSLIR